MTHRWKDINSVTLTRIVLTDLSELLIVFSFAYFAFWSGGYKNAKQQIKVMNVVLKRLLDLILWLRAENWEKFYPPDN